MKTTHGNSVEIPLPSRGIEKFDMPQDIKDKVYDVPPRIDPDNYNGKAMMVKWMGDMCSAVSAAGGCIFPVTAMGIGSTYFSKLVTHRFSLDDAQEAFDLFESDETGKVVFTMPGE